MRSNVLAAVARAEQTTRHRIDLVLVPGLDPHVGVVEAARDDPHFVVHFAEGVSPVVGAKEHPLVRLGDHVHRLGARRRHLDADPPSSLGQALSSVSRSTSVDRAVDPSVSLPLQCVHGLRSKCHIPAYRMLGFAGRCPCLRHRADRRCRGSSPSSPRHPQLQKTPRSSLGPKMLPSAPTQTLSGSADRPRCG